MKWHGGPFVTCKERMHVDLYLMVVLLGEAKGFGGEVGVYRKNVTCAGSG